MELEKGKTYLITTNDWFFAPDGESYKAVFGTLKGVFDAIETLGIKTNRGSTNWYIQIGQMTIAGCQIHYAFRCDEYNPNPTKREIEHAGELKVRDESRPRIYDADAMVVKWENIPE
jgi:hypothetical protein